MGREHGVRPGPVLRADADTAAGTRTGPAAGEVPAARDGAGADAVPCSGPGSAPLAGPGGNAHGRVPSWLLVVTVIAAFAAGGIALIAHVWWVFWVCVAVVVLAAPAGRLVGIMNDTVEWDVPLAGPYQPQGHVLLGPTPPLRDRTR